MGRLICNVMLFFFVVCALAGCGGGGGAASTSSGASGAITGVAWSFENEPADLNVNASSLLNVQVKCSASTNVGDIVLWTVTAPTGWHWIISPANSFTGTTSNGTPYIAASMWYGANPYAFLLAGTWKATITLASGETSSYDFVMQEPGSAANATHDFLYTSEEWTPSAPAQFVAALRRFPTTGCTFSYSANRIVSSGFATAVASYLAAEPRAYNLYLWLYDGNSNYVGYSATAYSLTTHAASDLLTPEGEISLAAGSVTGSTGVVNLSQVKYVRVIAVDGAQFPLSGLLQFHYRAISELVPVSAAVPLT